MKIKSLNNHKTLSYISIAAVLLAVGYIAVAYKNNYPPFAQNSTYKQGEYVVNMEKSNAEAEKTAALEESPTSKLQNNQTDNPRTPEIDDNSGRQQANVLLTNVGIFNNNVSASAVVTNIVEDGGECYFVFSGNGQKIVKTSPTMVSATSTSCKTVSFSANELPVAGKWEAVVEYKSPNSQGVSSAKEFTE